MNFYNYNGKTVVVLTEIELMVHIKKLMEMNKNNELDFLCILRDEEGVWNPQLTNVLKASALNQWICPPAPTEKEFFVQLKEENIRIADQLIFVKLHLVEIEQHREEYGTMQFHRNNMCCKCVEKRCK